MARAGHARKNPIPQTEHSMSGDGSTAPMKPTTRSGLWITLSASMALAFQSSVDALLPMAPGASVMVFFARPVLGLGVSALLLPLLERSPTSAGSITALGLAMSGALALVPQSFWSYHWAALAGAFVKVPLLCSLLLGDPAWAGASDLGHERKSDLRSLVLATLPASVALSGVVMAWLLLSVQLALLPLLHALHGHPLADRPLPLGLALLVSSFWLCHAPYPWMKSGPCLPLALCASSAIAALSMRGVAQAISGHDAWQRPRTERARSDPGAIGSIGTTQLHISSRSRSWTSTEAAVAAVLVALGPAHLLQAASIPFGAPWVFSQASAHRTGNPFWSAESEGEPSRIATIAWGKPRASSVASHSRGLPSWRFHLMCLDKTFISMRRTSSLSWTHLRSCLGK
eukprot:g6378.t1